MNIHNKDEHSRFKEHLSNDTNQNLILSGIFGIGKTHFLKEFFKDNNSFEAFRISPVHYSISANEDILNYVKYDLVFELLGKDIEYRESEIPINLSAQFYILDNFMDTFALLAEHSGQIGKKVSDIYKSFKTLSEAVKDHHKNTVINEKKELLDFLDKIKNSRGSIFEENRFTELIREIISHLSSTTGKENVLIIDDLDRLDPDHIFRILNVFACHLDFDQSSTNKFGFDKVILVCDIENIRKIFAHKYGKYVDFSGYIDKFFSTEIFELDNKGYILRGVAGYLNNLKISASSKSYCDFTNSNFRLHSLAHEIISELVGADLLNLRSILKKDDELKIQKTRFTLMNRSFYKKNFDILLVFELLAWIYGSKNAMLDALQSYALKHGIKSSNNNNDYGAILVYLCLGKHLGKKGDYRFTDHHTNQVFHYSVDQNYDDIFICKIRSTFIHGGKGGVPLQSDKKQFPLGYLLQESAMDYCSTNFQSM